MKKKDFNPAFYDAVEKIEEARQRWEYSKNDWDSAFWSEQGLSAFWVVANSLIGWAVGYRLKMAQDGRVPSPTGISSPALAGQIDDMLSEFVVETEWSEVSGATQRRMLLALLAPNPLGLPGQLNEQIVTALQLADRGIRTGLFLLERDHKNKSEIDANTGKLRHHEELSLRLTAIEHVQYRSRSQIRPDALREVANAFGLGGLSEEDDGLSTIVSWERRLDRALGTGTVECAKKSANHAWELVQTHLNDGNTVYAEMFSLAYSDEALQRAAARYKQIMGFPS